MGFPQSSASVQRGFVAVVADPDLRATWGCQRIALWTRTSCAASMPRYPAGTRCAWALVAHPVPRREGQPVESGSVPMWIGCLAHPLCAGRGGIGRRWRAVGEATRP